MPKSKIPKGYTNMQQRPADREIHKKHKIVMVWTQNKTNITKENSGSSTTGD